MSGAPTVHVTARSFAPVAVECEELRNLVTALCQWLQEPTTWIGGRSAWHVLPEGLAHRTGLRALKLKGLGLAPHDGRPAQLPRNEPYDRWPGQDPDRHFGIDDRAEFVLRCGSPAPLGGLSLAAALREFECAGALVAATVPSVVPVAVLEYTAGRIADERGRALPIGVAVTGSTTVTAERCSVLLPGASSPAEEAEAARLARLLGRSEPRDEPDRCALLGEVYRRFGHTLAAFSRCGWYRYSGHPANIALDDGGEAVMVDLDSSQRAEDVPPQRAALETVRDGMSALYNLACSYFSSVALDRLSDADLISHEPFSAFLDAWDPATAGGNTAEGQAIAAYVVRSREQLRRFAPFLRAGTTAAEHLYRHVRHDRDLTFMWLFRMLFARRLARPDGYPMPFDLDELDQRLLRFGGWERFERMEELVA